MYKILKYVLKQNAKYNFFLAQQSSNACQIVQFFRFKSKKMLWSVFRNSLKLAVSFFPGVFSNQQASPDKDMLVNTYLFYTTKFHINELHWWVLVTIQKGCWDASAQKTYKGNKGPGS